MNRMHLGCVICAGGDGDGEIGVLAQPLCLCPGVHSLPGDIHV